MMTFSGRDRLTVALSRIAGTAPTIGPTMGIHSVMAAKRPMTMGYGTPMAHMPRKVRVAMIQLMRIWPRM